jgi:hypothetical protein
LTAVHKHALNVNIDVAGFEKISVLFRGSARPVAVTPNVLLAVIPIVQDILLELAA